MATWIVGGPTTKTLDKDERTHRVYQLTYLIESDSTSPGTADGPERVSATPGLPIPGNSYQVDGDLDVWAYCLPTLRVEPHPNRTPDGPTRFWLAHVQFTTKPIERPILNGVSDPLFEPQKVTGNFIKFTEEGVYDRFGLVIANSAHEPFRGPQNEWDMARASIRIEQNVPVLGIDVYAPMIDTVNDRPLWGFPARFVKLQNVSFKEWYHRFSKYYTRTLDFEAWVRLNEDGEIISGWDRDILDEGTKVLRGQWTNSGTQSSPSYSWTLLGSPNPNNPLHFIRATDPHGNLIRVILNGRGEPYVPSTGETVDGCSVCPSGAPRSWIINGFNGLLTSDESDELYNGSSLDHESGCNWDYTDSDTGVNFALTYSSPTWLLTVSGLTASSISYILAGGSWSCNGVNNLSRVGSVFPSAPKVLSLSPGVDPTSRPGRRRTQKYHQSNFYLLGIPAVIGP